MKKTIITTCAFLMSLLAVAQADGNKNDARFFEKGNSYWTVDATFGVIAGWDQKADVDRLGDMVNVGLTVGVARTFKSNFFTAASASFSVAKETGLWSNPVNYFSANLEGGYKFKTGTFFVPFVALGANYIKAPNTIANSKDSFAFNPSAGINAWFKNSSFGVTAKFGYRFASEKYMGTHRYLTVGIIKKF
ncbi:hypothetical protein JL193_11575 [Polaribacter batillariae]|uniref:Outer membrane protein beta-barrel domain-containing protein n=1 Tax=Polaribacter batillariae TaxID=2808900 RepID=A0ABX7SSY1_9FLAO|nr:hypothetical protein [Polaribacter batillariae]QTD36769.1 hypothetical protein JL193_11575 [Polaribacter batillariae]